MTDTNQPRTLLIVDAQNDFMPGGMLEVSDGDQIVPVINRVVKSFDLVVATQDWHPEDHMSFASNHADKEPFDTIDIDGNEQVLWPDHCIQGTEGADIHPGLDIRRIEAIFRKGSDPAIDSYSGFYDNGHKKSTGLTGFLKEKGVKEIYFCGLAADICVFFTIMDALSEGFSAVVIEDATRPLDPEKYQDIREKLTAKGVSFVQSENISAEI